MTQPRLLIQAGPTLATLKTVDVNATTPHDVSSDSFEGSVYVRIAHYLGPKDGEGKPNPQTEMADGSTMSIAMQGRWKEDVAADDLWWGNYWDNPIRDFLPYGTSAALKFVHLVDPALENDVYADKPWALSPLLATMNYVSASHQDVSKPLPQWAPPVKEDVVAVFPKEKATVEVEALRGDVAKRKKFFNDVTKRKTVTVKPDTMIAADFCNGYIDFSTLSLKLPVGLSFALEHHWDGQPVTFVLRNREGTKTYFYVTFQIVKEGDAKTSAGDKKEKEAPPPAEEAEEKDTLGID